MPNEKYLWGSGGMLLTVGDRVKAFGVEVVICFFMMFVAFTSACDQPANAVFAYSIGFTGAEKGGRGGVGKRERERGAFSCHFYVLETACSLME